MNFPEEADIPEKYLLKNPIFQDKYLFDGELCSWKGPFTEALSPIWIKNSSGFSQKRIGKYPLMSSKEALKALDSAVHSFDNGRGLWPTLSVDQRIDHMENFTSQMKEKKHDIVTLLMWEIGKTLNDSEKEFDRTLDYIYGTIEALKELDRASSLFTMQEGVIAQIRRAPLGVVLCMGPYNYPLNETFATLIPALIMGNTVIFKPPKLGVLLFSPLLKAFCNSFPAGVINTIYGEGADVCGPLMLAGKIDALAFIGTSRVASVLKKQHPKPHRLRCILGLEAKNPAILLPDVDLDLVVKECTLGTLSFNGQRCTAIKIIFAHTSIVDSLLNRLGKEISKLKIGLPWDPNVFITPLPEPGKPEYLSELVKDALKKGAEIINKKGGSINKTYFSPAILFPVNSKMKIYFDEQFGPVIPIVPFDDIEDPIKYVIESNYGQQVSLFGNDPEMISQLIDTLVNQVCRVNINCQCQRGPDAFPFTGRKDSAEGTLSISDSLRVFSIRTLVATKDTELNQKLINRIIKERKSNFLSRDFIF